MALLGQEESLSLFRIDFVLDDVDPDLLTGDHPLWEEPEVELQSPKLKTLLCPRWP